MPDKSDPYDPPREPKLALNGPRLIVQQMADAVTEHLAKRALLQEVR